MKKITSALGLSLALMAICGGKFLFAQEVADEIIIEEHCGTDGCPVEDSEEKVRMVRNQIDMAIDMLCDMRDDAERAAALGCCPSFDNLLSCLALIKEQIQLVCSKLEVIDSKVDVLLNPIA